MVIPQKPYYDWDKAVFPKTDGIKPLEEFNSYLIEDSILPDDPKKALRKYWKWIFENELFEISTNEDTWPPNRTWKLFNEWFEIRISTLVMDLLDKPILRED